MNPLITIRLRHVKRGFALIVTLSLMILLTVIAVGLLTLSSVTLRASAQGEAGAAARANARLALMMAVGELQKELGPDSRISAPPDAGTNSTGGQSHWTAVYDAWERQVDASTPESPQTRNLKFRGWLVSGANQATGGPAGTPEKATLLSDKSMGGAATANDKILVPMLEVNTGKQRGRLAWWTADEAAKAKVNAGPDANTQLVFGTPNSLLDSQSPPNVGHHALSKLEQFDWKEGQRAKTISTAQVNLAADLVGQAGLGNISHDLTVSSAGILTDVRSGGLKHDLSNLLSRPVTELENKPLFLADGRINTFGITENGTVSNNNEIGSNSVGTANEWAINLEELSLFHNLHRQVTWTGGAPSLVAKNAREAAVKDRYFIYSKPTIEAVQFILSLKAVATGSTYKMQMMLDGVVALSNPNDVRIQIPPGLVMPLQLLNIPYDLKWNIRKKDGSFLTTSASSGNFDVFKGHVEGGFGSLPAAGFVLDPGEAATYGSSVASGTNLNLKRGFIPSGGVTMTGWNLNAANLEATDSVDFKFTKSNTPAYNGAFTYYNFWLGERTTSGTGGKGWQLDSSALSGSSTYGGLMDQLMPISIKPPQARPVSDFVTKAQPVLMFSFVRNVEQDSGTTPPDAFASRPFILNEPSISSHSLNASDIASCRHVVQTLITAEPMNYQFRSLAAGEKGRNIYHGGGRQPNLGGSFNVIKRRIPLAPPLSLGAFQNAIACGLIHFNEGAMPAIAGDPLPASADALSPWRKATSLSVAKAIGNSFCPPYLNPDQIYKAQSGAGGTTALKAACDYSWMANTALWDSWFLSSIIDGTGVGSSPWLKDSRSPRAQFKDLAEGKGLLRNKRYLFYPYSPPNDALEELFGDKNFKPSALKNLAKFLLIDGAFNVNSTSVNAWAAHLSSVRDHELLTASGATKKFDHPFGTLGYAYDTSTGDTAGDWSGLRNLTANEIKKLATAIVTEVKARGPFLSLADFVNRRPNSSDPSQQALGALQAAIDKSGLNDRPTANGRRVTSADFAPLSGSSGIDKEPKPARSMGSPGHLSQGDLLTAIGSQITVRSDTFTIRAYGDSRDSSGTKILAKAWCEAVIQRVPTYIDPADAPEAQNGWLLASHKLANANSLFGRRFLIQSFRWLGSNEI